MRERTHNAFTLIEMLVVIAIIVILAGIMLPVLSKVREYSHRTRVRDHVQQFEVVWENYLTDFRSFPAVDIRDAGNLTMQILGTTTTPYNKLYTYMDFTTNEWAKAEVVDFWGGRIQMSLDNGKSWNDTMAYDGKLTAGPHGQVYHAVAAWSKGRKNGLNGEPDDTSDDIKSW